MKPDETKKDIFKYNGVLSNETMRVLVVNHLAKSLIDSYEDLTLRAQAGGAGVLVGMPLSMKAIEGLAINYLNKKYNAAITAVKLTPKTKGAGWGFEADLK